MIAYLISVTSLAVAYDQYRMASASIGTRPDVGIAPLLFEIAGFVGSLGSTVMLVAGVFLGHWSWPLIALVLAVVANLCFRATVVRYMSWLVSLVASIIGATSAAVAFTA